MEVLQQSFPPKNGNDFKQHNGNVTLFYTNVFVNCNAKHRNISIIYHSPKIPLRCFHCLKDANVSLLNAKHFRVTVDDNINLLSAGLMFADPK